MTTLNFPVQQGFFFTTSVTEHFPTTASTISRLFPDRRHFPTRRTRGVRRTRPNGSSKSPATAHQSSSRNTHVPTRHRHRRKRPPDIPDTSRPLRGGTTRRHQGHDAKKPHENWDSGAVHQGTNQGHNTKNPRKPNSQARLQGGTTHIQQHHHHLNPSSFRHHSKVCGGGGGGGGGGKVDSYITHLGWVNGTRIHIIIDTFTYRNDSEVTRPCLT